MPAETSHSSTEREEPSRAAPVDARQVALDLAKAEYDALRQEILKRIGGQGAAFAATVALVGAFVGVLIQFKIKSGDVEAPLLTLILEGVAEDGAIGAFAVIAGGFTLGVELLLSFWAYQLHMMFRITHDLTQLIKDLRSEFKLPESVRVFEWTAKTERTTELWESRSSLASFGIRSGLLLQPFMLFGLTALGLILMGLALPACLQSETLSTLTKLAITTAFVLLAIGLAFIAFAMIAAHEPNSPRLQASFRRLESSMQILTSIWRYLRRFFRSEA